MDGGSVHLRGFTSKTGRKFDAMLVLDKEKGARFDFDDDQDRKNHHGRVRTA
ncbi:MAG: topoisomerase C-terminal repeat-containing protein [Bifidobacterium bifidum]